VIALAGERGRIEKLQAQEGAKLIMSTVEKGVRAGLRELGNDLGRYAEGLEKLARGWREA
jgi:hypothetical protein